ncbi:DUF2666 family protein [Candidatus Micrarchaeota archaeon]|nr:DUF2666 family protein [Candidatus Micrarchaeota archaeon]
MDREEIILTGEYKNFKSDRNYYVKEAQNNDIAAILIELSEFIEPYVYQFAGIDTKKIDPLIKAGQGLQSVCEFLKSFKRDLLLPGAQNKTTMLPIAESYLLNQLLKKAGVSFKPVVSTSFKPEVEKPEDMIAFIGNCKGWFSAKKLGIDEKTQDWEVAGILSGINHTLVNKSFDFAGMKSGEGAGGRKSLSSLANALSQVDANNPYAVCKTCEGFNIKPYASPEMLMDEYPDIKKPKVKGRKPKG